MGRLPGGGEVRAGVKRTSSETRLAHGDRRSLVSLQCKLWFKSCLSCFLSLVTFAKFLSLLSLCFLLCKKITISLLNSRRLKKGGLWDRPTQQLARGRSSISGGFYYHYSSVLFLQIHLLPSCVLYFYGPFLCLHKNTVSFI